jgi:hypothetical protein
VRVANLIGYHDRRGEGLYNLLGSAVTVDLSESGVRVRTTETLPVGGILTFEIKLGGEVFSLAGRIVWGEELDPDKAYEFGARFVDVPESLKEKLRVYVSLKQPEEAE